MNNHYFTQLLLTERFFLSDFKKLLESDKLFKDGDEKTRSILSKFCNKYDAKGHLMDLGNSKHFIFSFPAIKKTIGIEFDESLPFDYANTNSKQYKKRADFIYFTFEDEENQKIHINKSSIRIKNALSDSFCLIDLESKNITYLKSGFSIDTIEFNYLDSYLSGKSTNKDKKKTNKEIEKDFIIEHFEEVVDLIMNKKKNDEDLKALFEILHDQKLKLNYKCDFNSFLVPTVEKLSFKDTLIKKVFKF